MLDIERVLSSEELVCEGTDGPSVDLLVVVLPRQNFRREVEWSSAESRPELTRTVH